MKEDKESLDKEYKDKNVKLTVKKSTCEIYKAGDEIYIEKFLVDKEKSGPVCLTALQAIYPFIYAARKGVTLEQMGYSEMCFQCPDCDETAWFLIETYEDEE